jgi:hypothetical protein
MQCVTDPSVIMQLVTDPSTFRDHDQSGSHREELERSVCLPALPGSVSVLVETCPPPCVRFRDRRVLPLPSFATLSPAAENNGVDARSGMEAALAVQERWESFESSRRGY